MSDCHTATSRMILTPRSVSPPSPPAVLVPASPTPSPAPAIPASPNVAEMSTSVGEEREEMPEVSIPHQPRATPIPTRQLSPLEHMRSISTPTIYPTASTPATPNIPIVKGTPTFPMAPIVVSGPTTPITQADPAMAIPRESVDPGASQPLVKGRKRKRGQDHPVSNPLVLNVDRNTADIAAIRAEISAIRTDMARVRELLERLAPPSPSGSESDSQMQGM